MDRVVIDAALSIQLGGVPSPVTLYDDVGRPLGLFVPNRTLYEHVTCPESDEELTRRERSGGGRPLSEILADFEAKYGR
jgi:hypothetical protein